MTEAAEEIRAYLDGGRRFVNLELSTLTSRWLEARRDWAQSGGTHNSGELANLTAEFSLRQLEPPYELAPASDRTRSSIIETATTPFKEGFKAGTAAFGRGLKAEWKPYHFSSLSD